MGSSDDVFPGFTTCFDGDANPLADEGRFVLLGVRAVSLGLNGALSDVTFILSLDGVVTNFVVCLEGMFLGITSGFDELTSSCDLFLSTWVCFIWGFLSKDLAFDLTVLSSSL